MTSFTDHERGPVAGWRTSTHSAAGRACVEAKPFEVAVTGRQIVQLRSPVSRPATTRPAFTKPVHARPGHQEAGVPGVAQTTRRRRPAAWAPPGRGRDQAKVGESSIEVHNGSIEDVAGGELIEGDYRRDYPAAYQDLQRDLTALGDAILPRRVRAGGLDDFVTPHMNVHFQAALRHVGITTVSMRANGDCFFETFLNDEASPVVRQRLRDVLGTEPTVAGIRDHMADFLAAEFARLNHDPQAETVTAHLFPIAGADQADRVRRQNAFVRDIRTMGSYDNEASDRVPHMFAAVFGVPIDLWQPRYRTPIGWARDDQDVVPLTVIRQGAHYYHARTDDRREPTLVPPARRPAEIGERGTALATPSRERKRTREDEPVPPETAAKRIRLGHNVRTNALFDERRRAAPRMSAEEYRGFLEENIAGDRPMSFVVNIILRAGDVHQIPEVVDAVMRGYEGDPSRVGFVFGANRKEGAPASAEFGDTVTTVLSSLKYPAAIIDITFRGDFKPGAMRNVVLESEATRTLMSGLLEMDTYPYISIQDFDTGERVVPSGRHVFDHFADKFEIADDIEPLRPMMFGGGYRPGLKEEFKEGLREAILEDMQTRDRLAAIHRLLSYIPEPNLYLDGTLLLRDDSNIRFGPGSAEFGQLAEGMNGAYADELSLERTLGRIGPQRARTAAANNAHPLRGQAFFTDFVAGATVTELTRFDDDFTGTQGTLRQSHVPPGGVRNQLFMNRGIQDGVSIADYRAERWVRYQEREPFRFRETHYIRLPTGQRWEPLDAAEEEAMEVDPTGASLKKRWANKKSPHKVSAKAKWKGPAGSQDRGRLQIHKDEPGKGLNKRISARLSENLQDGILPGEERAATAGVQPDEAVLAVHLTAVSDQASTLLSQFTAIRSRLDAARAPNVQRSTLFGAVHRALGGGGTAENLRSAVVDAMVNLTVKTGKTGKSKKLTEQPILLQAVTRPYHNGDFVNAFVQNNVVVHVTGDTESQGGRHPDNAREMAARAIATHLHRTVVLHLADGETIEFNPFDGRATGRVDIDLHIADGQQLFTPHGESPIPIDKSNEAIAEDHATGTSASTGTSTKAKADAELLPDVEALTSAAQDHLGEAGAANVATYRNLLTHARSVLARLPAPVRAELVAEASERAASVHWTPPIDKTKMSREQTDLDLVVNGITWIMAVRRYLDRHRPIPWAVAENLSSHLADRLKTRGVPRRLSPGRGRQAARSLEIGGPVSSDSAVDDILMYRSSTYSKNGNPDEQHCVEVTAVRLSCGRLAAQMNRRAGIVLPSESSRG